MYKKSKYKGKRIEAIRNSIIEDGFNPILITNSADFNYDIHSHPETKLLVIVNGSMKVTVDNKDYECKKGDEIIIPGNVPHSAVIGNKGCSFYWSEKML